MEPDSISKSDPELVAVALLWNLSVAEDRSAGEVKP